MSRNAEILFSKKSGEEIFRDYLPLPTALQFSVPAETAVKQRRGEGDLASSTRPFCPSSRKLKSVKYPFKSHGGHRHE